MKICEYIPTASFFVGGGEIYPLLQSKALAHQGENVTLVTLKTTNESEYFKTFRVNNPKIDFQYLESPIEKEKSFSERELTHEVAHELYYSLSRSFAKLCSENKFDVVVTHYAPAGITVPGQIVEILFLHGVPSSFQIVNYVATKTANKLIAVSKSVREGWRDLYSTPSDIEILYNAVDTNDYYPVGNTPKDIDILYLGRLIEIKGIQHLIEAANLLVRKGIEIKLTIAGKGPYETELKNIVKKLGIEKNVFFTGYVEESSKLSLYNRSKVCVFPSYAKEGVLTTMLEAASCGCAVITSNCCGMTDFLKDGVNGLLFEPQNSQDLSEKILTLLKDDNLRNSLGESSSIAITKDWTWESHGKKFQKIISTLFEK